MFQTRIRVIPYIHMYSYIHMYYKIYNSNGYQVGHDLIDRVHCIDASLLEHEALPSSHMCLQIEAVIFICQGCKIPLASSHWRVNIGGGRVKLAVRSALPSSEFVILQQLAGKTAKRRPDFSEVYTRSGDHFLVCKYYP